MQKKTAQERRLRDKLRRNVNLTGKALETINPAFKKIIRNLDRLDKKVRKEAEDLNYFIGMARSFSRRRDYLTAATYLAKFHEKVKSINHQLKDFDGDISKSQREYLLKNFRGRDKSKLFEYDPDKKIENPLSADDGFVSTAGAIKDWWRVPGRFSDLKSNLFDAKTKGMKSLEKNFSIPFFKQLKADTNDILDESNSLYKELLSHFEEMGSAWATRNVGAYIEQINDIEKSYNPYHKKFVEFYTKNIAPLKEEQKRIDELNAQKINKEKELSDAGFGQEKDPFQNNGPPGPGSIRNLDAKNPLPSWLGPDAMSPLDAFPSLQDVKEVPDAQSSRVGPPTRPSATLQSPSSKMGPPTPSRSVDVDFSSEIVAPGGRIKAPLSEPFGKSPSYRSRPVNERPTMPSVKVAPVAAPPSSVKAPSFRPFVPPPSSGRRVGPVDILKFKDTPTMRGPFNPPPRAEDDSLPSTINRNFLPTNLDKKHGPFTERQPFMDRAHQDFFNRIEILSSEQDIVKEILAYSAQLEDYSEEESLKLLAVAEGLIEKDAGVFNRFVQKMKKKDTTNELPDSTNPPSSAPETEALSAPSGNNIEEEPRTLPAGPSGSPPQALIPKNKDDADILSDIRPPTGFTPVNHGIPSGTVEQRWFDIPFLAKKGPGDIKMSQGAIDQILKKLVPYLFHQKVPVGNIPNFNEKLVEAVKKSITRSKVISNLACGDAHNGQDCALEVFSYVRLGDIDGTINNLVLSFNVSLRLTVFGGEVKVGKISNPKLHTTKE